MLLNDACGPTPYRRTIKAARFQYHRWIQFDVCNVEDEQQDAGEVLWVPAISLGPAWDDAIDEYWRFVEARLEAEECQRLLRDMDAKYKRASLSRPSSSASSTSISGSSSSSSRHSDEDDAAPG